MKKTHQKRDKSPKIVLTPDFVKVVLETTGVPLDLAYLMDADFLLVCI